MRNTTSESYYEEILKYKTTETIDNILKIITQPIDQILTSKIYNCLILKSDGGVGKTSTVIRHLKSKGLKPNKNYLLHTGKRTTIEIIELLTKHNKQIHIFDDVELLTNDPDIIPHLKQAMQRGILSYKSRVNNIKPKAFLGKTIILCNQMPKSINIEALKQRCLIPHIHLTREDKLTLLREFIKIDTLFPELNKELKEEVVNHIESEIQNNPQGLNLRLFKLGCDTIRQFGSDWKPIFNNYYTSTQDLKTIAKTIKLKQWLNKGYGSKRNYYYLKKSQQ